MTSPRFAILVLMFAATLPPSLIAAEGAYTDDQSRSGPVVLHGLAISDAAITFRVSTGGCTDASSFTVDAAPAGSLIAGVPHYVLTIRRIRADECKAFIPEGTSVTLDLERAAGLSGRFTASVANPVLAAPRSTIAATAGIGRPLLDATIQAIRLETDATSAQLRSAEQNGASKETRDRLQSRLETLAEQLRQTVGLTAADYPAPSGAPEAESVFDQSTEYGPVIPSFERDIVITVTERPALGGLLDVEGTTRSGPFYRLAGIAGGDLSQLLTGRRYRIAAYLVYRREYFGFMGDYYVYAADVREALE